MLASAFTTPFTFTAASAKAFFGGFRPTESATCSQAPKRTRRFFVAAEQSSYKSQSGEVIEPSGDFILVKKTDQQMKTAGGILLPETAKDEQQFYVGEVLAVGPGATETAPDGSTVTLSIDIKPGERIIYPRYTAVEFEAGGEKFDFVRENVIMAVAPPAQ